MYNCKFNQISKDGLKIVAKNELNIKNSYLNNSLAEKTIEFDSNDIYFQNNLFEKIIEDEFYVKSLSKRRLIKNTIKKFNNNKVIFQNSFQNNRIMCDCEIIKEILEGKKLNMTEKYEDFINENYCLFPNQCYLLLSNIFNFMINKKICQHGVDRIEHGIEDMEKMCMIELHNQKSNIANKMCVSVSLLFLIHILTFQFIYVKN